MNISRITVFVMGFFSVVALQAMEPPTLSVALGNITNKTHQPLFLKVKSRLKPAITPVIPPGKTGELKSEHDKILRLSRSTPHQRNAFFQIYDAQGTTLLGTFGLLIDDPQTPAEGYKLTGMVEVGDQLTEFEPMTFPAEEGVEEIGVRINLLIRDPLEDSEIEYHKIS